MLEFLKREKVLTIAIVLAIWSMFFVHPDKEYIQYVDVRVLALLFCLMLIVKGFQDVGLFQLLVRKVFGYVRTTRQLALVMMLACFLLSMLITNDVALITFVPFALLALRLCHQEKMMIRVVVLQTLAANLGSMLTPIGSPQNLYLYTVSGMGVLEFIIVMLPLWLLSFALLLVGVLVVPKEKIVVVLDVKRAAEREDEHRKHTDAKWVSKIADLNKRCLFLYFALFIVNLLVVFRVIHWLPAILITIAGVLFLRKQHLLRQVDYALLLTFVGFFVFVGNVGRIQLVSQAIERLLLGREILIGAVFSQFLSNVPAALLLSGFTDNLQGLLLGCNIGGLGTLIASMASLISYKFYAAEVRSNKRKYMRTFTLANIVMFAILLSVSLLIF